MESLSYAHDRLSTSSSVEAGPRACKSLDSLDSRSSSKFKSSSVPTLSPSQREEENMLKVRFKLREPEALFQVGCETSLGLDLDVHV